MLIALFAPTDVHSLEIAGVRDAFAEANSHLEQQADYEIVVVSESRDPITTSSGLRVLPEAGIADPIGPIDTLIVIGTYSEPPPPSPEVQAWLRERAADARRYGAVCTGAFLLAAAGLLHGRRVTTHWEYADRFAAEHPDTIMERDRIFVRDGPLFTSAGVAASIDLALALIEEDHGRRLALAVARSLVVYLKRPGGQSQFSAQLAAQVAQRSPIQRVQQWIRDEPAQRRTVRDMARHAGMSERNFARAFSVEARMTPADFLEAVRVDAARRLLEDTRLSLHAIGAAVGFGGATGLRRAFGRHLRVTPRDYRARFQSTQRDEPDGRSLAETG